MIAFGLGATSIALSLIGQDASGWARPLLGVALPTVFGASGVVLGALARRWLWVVLNGLVLLWFPGVMFFGTLFLGP